MSADRQGKSPWIGYKPFLPANATNDRPYLEVGLQSTPATLAADTGLLESTERRQRRVRCAVDHYATAIQLGHTARARHVGALKRNITAIKQQLTNDIRRQHD